MELLLLLLPLHVRVALEETLGHGFLSLSYLDEKVALVQMFTFMVRYVIHIFYTCLSEFILEC